MQSEMLCKNSRGIFPDALTLVLAIDFPMIIFYWLIQIQAIEMYGAAQPDFFKSEINGGIKTLFHII